MLTVRLDSRGSDLNGLLKNSAHQMSTGYKANGNFPNVIIDMVALETEIYYLQILFELKT